MLPSSSPSPPERFHVTVAIQPTIMTGALVAVRFTPHSSEWVTRHKERVLGCAVILTLLGLSQHTSLLWLAIMVNTYTAPHTK